MSRLLAPVWDLKLLCELTPGLKANDTAALNASLQEPLSFATFTEIDLQWFLNKLNELKRFLDLNFAHLRTQKYSHLNPSLFGGFGSTSGITTDLNASANQPAGFSKLNQQPGQLNQIQPRFATQFSSMPINLSALINLTTGIIIIILIIIKYKGVNYLRTGYWIPLYCVQIFILFHCIRLYAY